MKIKNNIAISDSGFIFNPSNGESFSVNPIGVEIISLLKEGKTDAEIKKAVLDKYQTDDATFEKDFYDFISLLKNQSLLEVND